MSFQREIWSGSISDEQTASATIELHQAELVTVIYVNQRNELCRLQIIIDTIYCIIIFAVEGES